ncbi:hypothetical protein [Daejeonella sp.]|uniref:hypothetical protein n=1 Tax=Daejeonella sp. TaxID=2805397 RepID=UPI0037BFC3E1
MKKFRNCTSPFIMLLIPVFLLLGLFAFNYNNEVSIEKHHTILKLQVPSLKMIVKSVIK